MVLNTGCVLGLSEQLLKITLLRLYPKPFTQTPTSEDAAKGFVCLKGPKLILMRTTILGILWWESARSSETEHQGIEDRKPDWDEILIV